MARNSATIIQYSQCAPSLVPSQYLSVYFSDVWVKTQRKVEGIIMEMSVITGMRSMGMAVMR